MLIANSWLAHDVQGVAPLSRFLELMHFDWADVRELKGERFSEELESYRDYLLSLEQHPDVEEARSALRLLEKWFTRAATEHCDTHPELDFFILRLVGDCRGRDMAGRYLRSMVFRRIWIQNALCSLLLAATIGHLGLHSGDPITLGIATLDLGVALYDVCKCGKNHRQIRETRAQLPALLTGNPLPQNPA